jgi:hypothetical protein
LSWCSASSRGAGLAVEPVQELEIGAGSQDLEGHDAAEPHVAGAVHLAHAARSQAVDHFVGADARSRCEG